MLLIIHLAMMLSFIVLGSVFMSGKGAWLIAGYNTSSAYEKSRTDEKALCRFMGRSMFVLAACWIPICLSAVIDKMWLLWAGLGLFFIAVMVIVIYANTGNRFKY
ncbi:MAG: DUF3784 domain-containing protein [Firmicutes bacterium]|nr:DUF3784 domain-containing protein [Bacillota bacterium]